MTNGVKRIALLGSTGSIGCQTLDVVRSFPERFKIVGLAAGRNVELLSQQTAEFNPKLVYHEGQNTLEAKGYEFVSLAEMASHPEVDVVVIATSGKAGLEPALAALRAGKEVALANKEPLVMAGEIIMGEARKHGGRILPIDSEHSAIWQCLRGERQKPARLILTASGGPFRRYSRARLKKVTVEQTLKHPSWQMGRKVTVDSATLMNKGLEVIEAHWLFNMPYNRIQVLIHPQSIIHSLVEFSDGSVKAQLSYPDMRIPIQYALSYPKRLANPRLPRLDWNKILFLIFEEPAPETFPCLKLAREAGEKGGTYPAVLCGADEVAVELFLAGRLRFDRIPWLLARVLKQHMNIPHPSLEDIVLAEAWGRERANKLAEVRL
ncbi:MAG: 1-deoxy-D-xylulose-5-phosphate reductoisomerase [Chloroflexota bacterium]